MASLQELTQQIVNLSDSLNTAMQRIQVLEQRGSGTYSTGQGNFDETRAKGGIFDKQNMLPEKLVRQLDFREWSEEYLEYIEFQSEHLAELLTVARDSDRVITGTGEDEDTKLKAKALYKSLKRNVVLPEAKAIVANVPDKNPFEAWRQLFGKYDPRNDATAQRMIDVILDRKVWKCNKIEEITTKIAKWEALQREHLKRTGEEAINVTSKRALLKGMLPDQVKDFLEVHTIFKPGLTYDVIKQAVLDLVQRTTGVNTAMLVDAVAADPSAVPSIPASLLPEDVDSLARRPPATKPGKGDGKGDNNKGGGKAGKGEKETRTCHNCGRPGHIVKDCWRPKRAKGAGKGAGKVGHRERSEDGRWFRRTGVNSWEIEEDQQGDDGCPWECGNLEAVALGSGLDDSEYLGLNGAYSLEESAECNAFDLSGFPDLCTECSCQELDSWSGEWTSCTCAPDDVDACENDRVNVEQAIPGFGDFCEEFARKFGGPCVDALGDLGGDDDDEDPLQQSDAWTEHLALSGRTVGPRGKGNPVLTMAAKGVELPHDAFGTPLKPKPAEEFDKLNTFAESTGS